MWSLRLPIKVACTGNAGTRVARGEYFHSLSGGVALFLCLPPPSTPPPFAFASRVACGAALRGGSAALPPHDLSTPDDNVRHAPTAMPMMVAMPVPLAVTPILPLVTPMLATKVQTVMQPMVSNLNTVSRDLTMRLGASLRDRATLSSPLRGLAPSGGYPSRLRSLWSLRAPLARRLASLTAACRPATASATFDGIVETTAAFSSRRRFAQRSSRPAPRSPWPAAPAAGIAMARPGAPRASPGAGFAAHRSLHSCGRSCGAHPHFAPHRAVQLCPHECGHFRPPLRQRAAHDCLRLPPHRPPLNRRGGSLPPASPASIPPSLIPQIWPS